MTEQIVQTQKKPRTKLIYVCEDCGSEHESGRKRSGPIYCSPCLAIRRKEGRGPIQEKRASGSITGEEYMPEIETRFTTLAIEASILEPRFVDIGRARTGKVSVGLKSRLGEKISDHQKNIGAPHSGSQLNNASKTAAEMGWCLEVSWAETESNESAEAHEAALIWAYYGWNGRMPNFKSDTGRWVTGNRNLPNENRKGTVSGLDKLDWSGWMPMDKPTIDILPAKPGVYRIRAVPPGS